MSDEATESSAVSSDPPPAAPERRAALGRLIGGAAWELDRGTRDGHASLFANSAVITANERTYGPERGADAFWDAVRADPARRHCQTWHSALRLRDSEDGVELRSYVMVVQRQASGTIGIYWLGYAIDSVAELAGTWLFRARELRPWAGDVVGGFPSFRALQTGERTKSQDAQR